MKRSTKLSRNTLQNPRVSCILTLALALCLSITGTAVAAPANQVASPAWLDSLNPEQAPAQVRKAFADVLSAQPQAHQAMAGTITVTSCANSGNGSLRAAVAAATSGDTIDLSQLTCTHLSLSSQITIAQASLTIKGKPGTSILNPPKPTIDGTQSGRIFNHTGTGTLILKDTYLTNGHIDHTITGTADNFGGCVFSNGDVKVDATYVASCDAEAGGNASGGGIYAKGKIILAGGSVIVGNKVTGAWYAKGGGLYSATAITLQGAAVVNTNAAIVQGNGFARGGGLYAVTGIIGAGQLTLEHNKAEATGTSVQAVTGGGAYVGSVWASDLIVNDNQALGAKGEGGGLYAFDAGVLITDSTFTHNGAGYRGGGVVSEGNASIKTSTISDNTSGYGGGIYAEADLNLEASTVANNTASSGAGGVYATNKLTLADSNIIGNHAGVSRGGIAAYGNIAMSGSTIADNTSAHVAGAGLGGVATTLPITITHSTISGNQSSDSKWGAGLYLLHDAVIKNSTISGNYERNATDTHYGAGISLGGSGVQLTLSSSIVSGNGMDWGTGPFDIPQADDIGKAYDSSAVYDIIGSHNMIGSSTVPIPADSIGQAGIMVAFVGLSALADNGGPTLTRLPDAASLAIDNGTDNGFDCDQRHDGFARIAGFAADIGAVELQDNENTDRIFASGFEVISTSCN